WRPNRLTLHFQKATSQIKFGKTDPTKEPTVRKRTHRNWTVCLSCLTPRGPSAVTYGISGAIT
ncbi:hypothetical protein CEXT_352361, partial [Caerostris extrusa]